MGRLVSNSFRPALPISTSSALSPPKAPPLPNPLEYVSSIGAHGFADTRGAFVGDGSAGEYPRLLPGENERRPSTGGGESVRLVSGDWSWYGAKSILWNNSRSGQRTIAAISRRESQCLWCLVLLVNYGPLTRHRAHDSHSNSSQRAGKSQENARQYSQQMYHFDFLYVCP
jgi:hypothetical protein